MSKVLITGGAGFIGSALARRLTRDGHVVVVLDDLVPQVHGQSASTDLECEVIVADVRDKQQVRLALRGVDVVHHLAAETGVGQSQYEPSRYVAVNTLGTAVVLEAAIEAGVRQVVIASSRAVYGEGRQRCTRCGDAFTRSTRLVADMDAGRWNVTCPHCDGAGVPEPTPEETPPTPASVYGVTKLHQEHLASHLGATHSLPVTILRLFNVFGPGQSMLNPYVGVLGIFFRRAREGAPLELYEDGLMLRDFVFVDDVVEVFTRCTDNPDSFGATWNVGTGAAVSLLDVARTMLEALGQEARVEVSGRYRVGDIRHSLADVSKLRRQLGYQPPTPFDEGLTRFLTWAAAEGGAETPDAVAEEQLTARQLLRRGAR